MGSHGETGHRQTLGIQGGGIVLNIYDLLVEIRKHKAVPSVVGIDLTGSEKRPSGVSILQGVSTYLSMENADEDIILKTINANPTVISIDSPLGIPKGRCCSDDSCECRKHGILRECERTLRSRGTGVYPCLIQSMQKLTMRGIKLAEIFREKGFEVIESYPGVAQDILGIPRKKKDLKGLEVNLMDMGIVPNKEKFTHDELDALTSALVGYFYLAEMYEAIGNEEEGFLITPRLEE